MAIHESSVNFENLIRDLADMYPHEVPEVVIVELVANALDAGATRISVDFDPQRKTLVVADNGEGMSASAFDEYHDFAAGLKRRGETIGFAGVGAKISFNVADRVLTETRSRGFHGGSNWHLQSKKRLVWEDWEPSHLQGKGTWVQVSFREGEKLPYSSQADIVELLRRHYLPLFDSEFLELYDRMGVYSRTLRLHVNGAVIEPGGTASGAGMQHVRKFLPKAGGKRIGLGILGLASSDYPLGEERCGLLLCTRGKVVKADLFNQFPGALGPRIFGLVEIPGFADFLTTAKTDFVRRLKPGRFERLYGPVREEFKAWLKEVGIQPTEAGGTDEATKLERELRKVLDDIPELSEFFGFRERKPVLQEQHDGTTQAELVEGVEATFPAGQGAGRGAEGPLDVGDDPGQALQENPKGDSPAAPVTRTARRGPKIGFFDAPDRVELAWVDGNSVTINSGHPSYPRASGEATARRRHCLFAIGGAIQRYLATDTDQPDLMFIDRLMAAWGKK